MDSNNLTQKTQFSKISSQLFKSVSLYDWWLVRAEGKGLAVAGVGSRESLQVRAFCSAPIAKRHDTTTLETADGITLTINGFINRSRALQNGFPLEVCNHFLHGFPYYWEEYAGQCGGQDYTNSGVSSGVSHFAEANTPSDCDANSLQPVSFDDIPVTRMRDLLTSPQGHSENGALQREIINVLIQCARNSVQDENPSNHNKATADQKCRAVKRTKEIKTGTPDILTPRRGVVTRSMARLQNLGSKLHERSADILSQFEGMVTGSRSKGCHAVTFYDDDEELWKNPDNSAVRRSSRLKNQAKASQLKP